MSSCCPHIHLKFGAIQFINKEFIPRILLSSYSSPKFLGALSPETKARIPKQLSTCGTEVLYPHAKFGGDQFTHGEQSKIRVFMFIFVFVCHAGHGLFWSRRLTAMFGILMKYSYAIY